MADPRGFMNYKRENPTRRPVKERLHDWHEVYLDFPQAKLIQQATRCMDCGIPFCHEGCPLANLIPEWNDLVRQGHMSKAIDRLHATNNFPDFTGRVCPAPCEGSCVLGISDDPVAIKQIEYEIAKAAAKNGFEPVLASIKTGKKIAVIGSGPAGLACAQQLTRAGHDVTVFERAEKIGGLLRYGIPEFKLEKQVLDQRLAQMEAEGTVFVANTSIGDITDEVKGAASRAARVISPKSLHDDFDAVVLAIGSTKPRDLNIEGRDLDGIAFAMDYLKSANLTLEGLLPKPLITAEGKDVVIIGGGDTGADCLGTVHRQGANSVTQLEILPQPPKERQSNNPWPTWPRIFRISSAHEEGGKQMFAVTTKRFITDGNHKLSGIEIEFLNEDHVDKTAATPTEGKSAVLPAQLALLAMGFTGPEQNGLVGALKIKLNERANIAVDSDFMTNIDGVFACGDASRGQSLVVWAIAEGRACAAKVDTYLTGRTYLPQPLIPGQSALV